MPQSLSSILIHLVFSTKNREPFITPTIELELHPYMAKIFRAMKSPSLAIDGTVDHVHILFSLGRVTKVADLVEEVKTESSKWIKTKGLEFRNFHWQAGYGAFSIGQSNVAQLKRYIRSQKQHHRRVTFQDEYRKFLALRDCLRRTLRLGLIRIPRFQRSLFLKTLGLGRWPRLLHFAPLALRSSSRDREGGLLSACCGFSLISGLPVRVGYKMLDPGGNLMRILLTITMLVLAATAAYPQRCGDSLFLYLRDQNGKVIAPSDLAAKVSATYTVDNVSKLVDAEPQIKELPQGVKGFSVRAECGMKLAQFRLKNKGQEMTIRVLNVPGDAGHILLDGIVFRKGTYEVDLGNRPMQNVESYEGGSAQDPADEIKWVIKDKSLKKVG